MHTDVEDDIEESKLDDIPSDFRGYPPFGTESIDFLSSTLYQPINGGSENRDDTGAELVIDILKCRPLVPASHASYCAVFYAICMPFRAFANSKSDSQQ